MPLPPFIFAGPSSCRSPSYRSHSQSKAVAIFQKFPVHLSCNTVCFQCTTYFSFKLCGSMEMNMSTGKSGLQLLALPLILQLCTGCINGPQRIYFLKIWIACRDTFDACSCCKRDLFLRPWRPGFKFPLGHKVI